MMTTTIFDGILTQAARDTEVVVVSAPSDTSSMLAKLKAVRAAVPQSVA